MTTMHTTKKIVLAAGLLAAAAAFLAATPGALAQATDWKQIKSPALKSFAIPSPERYVMKNGVVVMLFEDHELPLIDVTARVHTGGKLEPADRTGLAGITGTVMRTGGAKGKSGDEIDDWLDARGARIETSISNEAGSASASCLKGDFPDVVQLFADVLRAPSFDEAKLKVAKNQAMSAISRRNDNPMGIMFREGNRLVYGPDSPYARNPEYATISAISQADLKAFHAKYYMPNRLLIGVTGDFDSKEMKAQLERVFGDWAKGPEFKDPEAAYQKAPKPGYYRVVKSDMTQSDVIMGHLGVRQDNPDLFAIEVMNEVLSGSFASRLFTNVRTKKGLAYAVRGSMDGEFDHPGTFNVWVTTKTETTGAAIDALLEEVDGIVNRPATEDEVTKAKQSILNSFIFNYDSRAKVMRQQLTYEYYGYPRDFLARFKENIEKVTTPDVARVAKQYVHKSDLAILVVGKKDGLDKPLESYGKIADLDIAIPESSSAGTAVAAAPGVSDAEAASKGAALVTKAVGALGGAEKVDAIKSLRIVEQSNVSTPRGEMNLKGTRTFVYPDKVRQEMTTPMGPVTLVATPGDAFMSGPMGVRQLPDSQRAEMLKALKRSPLLLFRHRAEPTFSAKFGGTADVDSVKADLLNVTYEGETIRLFLDPVTGRVLRAASKGPGPGGAPADLLASYSDYRDVSGIPFPYVTKITVDGEPLSSTTAEEISVNVTVDDSQFTKPAGAASPSGGN
ncbi:MAG: insulinase family protein [Acidobacteria bacterium]|nr:insulinase family protein [Acidobacteriota bacterium]